MIPEWNFLPEREFHSEPKPESTQSRKDTMKFVQKQQKKKTRIVRAWLAERCVFAWKSVNMVVTSSCFSIRANHPSTNLKKWVENSTNLLYSPINSRSETLENLYKHAVYCFKREKPLFWKASFIVKLITHTSFVYKTARLVTLLISNLNKEFPFFSRKLFYKSKSGLVIKPRADGHDIVGCNMLRPFAHSLACCCFVSVHKNAKKKPGQNLVILTLRVVNNANRLTTLQKSHFCDYIRPIILYYAKACFL